MKKLIALMLASILLLSLAGCGHPEEAEPGDDRPGETILKAWTGEYSKNKREEAIREYQRNYSNIVFEDAEDAATVTFEVEHDVASCYVSMVAPVSQSDMEVEVDGYIDLFVKTEYQDNKVTIHTGWGLEESRPVWSYLVCVKDTEGAAHYYYFRVDYTMAQASMLTCYTADHPSYANPDLQMSKDQAQFIIQVWNDSVWEDDVSKTAYDFVFHCGDREVRYCYDAGIFNDWTNNKHMVLSSDMREQVNATINKFTVLPYVD